MEVGLVRQIDIDTEMQQSYLDYAMSVIVSRALPDARDGLKPVHRRILFAMHSMGIRPDTDFKKSARIVGEVLGKFHPHGDMAVYDAMVRMAQGFSMRSPLIEGQGNFGSVDGDPPAAMRYTEARMSSLAAEVLEDIDKDTVDFVDNFDGSLREPTVLPSAIPNMLVNGATGIAVGMATSIPPHNMREVCDALIFLLKNWSHVETISLDDLMNFIQGPDFPTGGIIVHTKKDDGEGLAAAYGSGRGKITVQARAHIEEMGRGRSRIIVTELPFQINKSNLIERIADLVRAGTLDGLVDLRDESDRQGMRIVFELSKTADPEKVLANLYRRTPMQATFSVIMLALVNGEPRLLNLKQALRVYLEHRVEVVRRRSQFELDRAKKRVHILEAFQVALKNLDAIISLIRNSKDSAHAHQRLRKRFKFTIAQANAILDMPLRRLSSLERKKINLEFKEVTARIKELEALLRSEVKIRGLISQELTEIKTKYGDPRRTHIVLSKAAGKRITAPLTATDVASAKETWVVITKKGQISKTPSARLPRLSGRDAPRLVIGASGRDTLYLFDKKGNAAALPTHTLPESSHPNEGTSISNVTPFGSNVELVAGIAISPEHTKSDAPEEYLIFTTKSGMVKKSSLMSLPGPSAKLFTAVKVAPKDTLGWVHLSSGKNEIILVSHHGMAIRFPEEDVRPMGLAATGVIGMKLDDKDDHIVGMDIVRPRTELFILAADGSAKRTSLSQYPKQGRYGKGVLTWKSGADVRLVGAAIGFSDHRAIIRMAKGSSRSIRFADAQRKTRTTPGRILIELKEGDRASSFSPVILRPPNPETPQKASSRKQTTRKKTRTSTRKPATSTTKKKTTTKQPVKRSTSKASTRGSSSTSKKTTSSKSTSKRSTTRKKSSSN